MRGPERTRGDEKGREETRETDQHSKERRIDLKRATSGLMGLKHKYNSASNVRNSSGEQLIIRRDTQITIKPNLERSNGAKSSPNMEIPTGSAKTIIQSLNHSQNQNDSSKNINETDGRVRRSSSVGEIPLPSSVPAKTYHQNKANNNISSTPVDSPIKSAAETSGNGSGSGSGNGSGNGNGIGSGNGNVSGNTNGANARKRGFTKSLDPNIEFQRQVQKK
jgi:hypothetical protein